MNYETSTTEGHYGAMGNPGITTGYVSGGDPTTVGPTYYNQVPQATPDYAGIPDPAIPIQAPNKIRQLSIEEVNLGYIVRIGCHTFAITSKHDLIAKLSEYINEPNKTESKWFEGKLF